MSKSLQPQSTQKDESDILEVGFVKIPKSKLPTIEKIFLLVILALAVFIFLPKLSSIEETLLIVKSLKPWAVLLAIATQMLRLWANGLTISECVNIAKQEFSAKRGILISMASYSFGLVAGGMFGSAATTYRWVRASGGNNESASLAASIPAIFISFIMAAISFIGMIFLLTCHSLTTLQIVSYLLISLFLAAIGILLIIAIKHKEKSIEIALSVLGTIFKFFKKRLPVEKAEVELNKLFTTWEFLVNEGWKGPMLGSTLSVVFDMFTVYFLFIAADNPISLAALVMGYGLPNLFGRMAFMIPGGVGIIESTMVAFYSSLGAENSIAPVVVLAYRLFSFWLPAISGFVVLPYMNRLASNDYDELPE